MSHINETSIRYVVKPTTERRLGDTTAQFYGFVEHFERFFWPVLLWKCRAHHINKSLNEVWNDRCSYDLFWKRESSIELIFTHSINQRMYDTHTCLFVYCHHVASKCEKVAKRINNVICVLAQNVEFWALKISAQ